MFDFFFILDNLAVFFLLFDIAGHVHCQKYKPHDWHLLRNRQQSSTYIMLHFLPVSKAYNCKYKYHEYIIYFPTIYIYCLYIYPSLVLFEQSNCIDWIICFVLLSLIMISSPKYIFFSGT